MRIGVLTSLYPGPSRPNEGVFAERRWLGMRARGHDVRVVQPMPHTPGPLARGRWAEIRDMPRHETRGSVEVSRPRYLHLPGRARGNARRFAGAGMRELLRGQRPDVVVCDYAWPAAAAAPLLAERDVPCVVNGRGSDVLEVAGEAGLGGELGTYLAAAGHWCAVSSDLVRTMDRLASEVSGDGGAAARRGVLVPNGVDLELFRPRERAAARSALGLDPDAPLVLVVGHWIPRKDPLLSLEAFARGAPPDARAVFLGRGPLAAELGEAVRARGLESRVKLQGEVPAEELATWYAACDVLLLTSRREGRPNVVLEALASGRPVLATVAGGTAELLAGWEETLLCETREPAALGERLARILAQPPPPERLRETVRELSWEHGLEALEGCLEDARAGAAERR